MYISIRPPVLRSRIGAFGRCVLLHTGLAQKSPRVRMFIFLCSIRTRKNTFKLELDSLVKAGQPDGVVILFSYGATSRHGVVQG